MKIFELLPSQSSHSFWQFFQENLGEFRRILHFFKGIFINTEGKNENLGYFKIFK